MEFGLARLRELRGRPTTPKIDFAAAPVPVLDYGRNPVFGFHAGLAELFLAAPLDDAASAQVAWNLLRPFRAEQFLDTQPRWDGSSPLYGRDDVVPCFGTVAREIDDLKERARVRAFPDAAIPSERR
jgi:hypothetical protein